jgi:hypothetical protein
VESGRRKAKLPAAKAAEDAVGVDGVVVGADAGGIS